MPRNVLGYHGAWILYIAVLACPSVAAAQGHSPEILQHYKAAVAFGVKGDQTQAAIEYKAFLAAVLPVEEKDKGTALAAELSPAIADAYNNLGVAAAADKDFSAAANYFEKAAQWKPALTTVDRNWGMAEFYGKRYSEATAPLERQLSRRPDDSRVRAALGLSYFSLENYAKTLATLQPIETTVQDDPGLGSAYGLSLVKTGEYDRGMGLLKAVEKANPDAAEIHSILGSAYADQGVYASALDEYHRALALDPTQARTHFRLGLALIRQGNPAGAVPELRAALRMQPADVASKYHLAFALLQSEQKPEARRLLQEVLQQDGRYFDAYYQLGKLQLEQGETKSAIGNLEAGSTLSPESDYIHYQLAMAYRRDSRPDDAAREMQRYQELKSRRSVGQADPQN